MKSSSDVLFYLTHLVPSTYKNSEGPIWMHKNSKQQAKFVSIDFVDANRTVLETDYF